MAKKSKIPQKLQPWIEARRRHHLSHAQVQMARELGMNPKKLGKLDNHKQESWKLPLPQFIEKCYRKTFKRDRPLDCRSIEDRVAGKPLPLAPPPRPNPSRRLADDELQRINRLFAEAADEWKADHLVTQLPPADTSPPAVRIPENAARY